MRLAVVGASGLVGRKILELLEERRSGAGPLSGSEPPELYASPRSAGVRTAWGELRSLDQLTDSQECDLVLMSAGASVSSEWAPRFVERGAVVIDNSSAWRADASVPLVISEINQHHLRDRPLGIIANPNCVTMAVLLALAPLHERWGLESFTATTFQAAGGAGEAGIRELLSQQEDAARSTHELTHGGELEEPDSPVHGRPLAMNVIPLLGELTSGDHSLTDEEEKLISESRKILDLPSLEVSPTCVRVPTMVGHGTELRATFSDPVSLTEAKEALDETGWVDLSLAPTPRDAAGSDGVLVGRLRDDWDPKTLNLWVVSDNLRTGAATNAVNLAERVALTLGGEG